MKAVKIESSFVADVEFFGEGDQGVEMFADDVRFVLSILMILGADGVAGKLEVGFEEVEKFFLGGVTSWVCKEGMSGIESEDHFFISATGVHR